MNFLGYKRPDGKVGIRNYVLILPTCSCSSETCRKVAEQVKETVAIPNQNGCAQVPGDLEITRQVLAGLASNPNVYGTILIGLGCENAQPQEMKELILSKTNKPLEVLVIQEEGGTVATLHKATLKAREMVEEASILQKEPFPLSELIIGTECGGSDPTSGIASNPVVGNLSDRVVDLGGTIILCETTEFIGAEHLLAERAVTKDVANRIIGIVRQYEEHIQNVGENLRKGNPAPGNKVGGITTLEEKSLGCIHKGGHRPIVEVVDYAMCPTQKGLVIMDTPGFDIASVVGMASGGAQVVVFTTGRGTPTGNPIVPVVKITANQQTFDKMKDNIDFNVSQVIAGQKSIDEMGERLLKEVLEVARGKVTKAEVLGFQEFAINRLCNYV